MLIQWGVMVFIIVLVTVLTKRLETIPHGSQIWIELIVEKINDLVRANMGEKFIGFAPYIGTIMIYILMLNLIGLLGLRPPTTDYSVALALALISFVLIHATAIKNNGLRHYLKGYSEPFPLLLPLNIIERVVVPVSLSLRLFGNMLAGVIIVELIYKGLSYLSNMVHIKLPLFAALIPIPFHIYFDIFDGIIQMFIFSMLTMIFIKTTSEH
ncbi:F0F1 ATP synthase subunit A [Fervidicella metallireducens AeB]|uniref:ATP synthase subunit a n=1 Tax=Fervidicella metallireducens AeB TaxID=1403537 RepID=A0A017RZJ3_9CLOT|nr:F0F1 ATP synthase subunit A [Fervidicella metallireducens AeB]